MEKAITSLAIVGLVALGWVSQSSRRSCERLTDNESSKIQGAGFTLSSNWPFYQCAEIELCTEFKCVDGGSDEANCSGKRERAPIERDNITGCGQESGINFEADCEEFRDFFGNHQCSTSGVVCKSVLDEFENRICVEDPDATATTVEATAPDWCVTWW